MCPPFAGRPSSLRELACHFLVCAPWNLGIETDYLRTPELNGAVPIVGASGAGAPLTRGAVLLQVGTAFVVPTDGQEYDPTDGAVTVPMETPDCP